MTIPRFVTARRRHRAAMALALLPAVAATLGACSTAAGSDSLAHATQKAQTVSAPASVPVAVDAATPDVGHATDFLVAWFDTLNYGFATGDADPLRTTTSLGCFTCAEWIKQVQAQSDADAVRTDGLVALRNAALVGQDGGDFVFRASLEQQAGSVRVRGTTATPVPAAGSTELVDLRVGRAESLTGPGPRWVMKSITPPS